MRRLAKVLTFAMLLAGCGGTSWSSAQGSSTAPTTAPVSTTPTSTRTAAVAEKAYVDAMVASATTDGNPAGLKVADWRCVASALVHGFGVSTFAANGITPSALRKPDSSLAALPEPTDTQISTIGTALQRCRVGVVLARSFATGLNISDPAAVTCLTGRVDTDPALRRFVVMTWLGRKMQIETARDVVGLMAACVDLTSFILRSWTSPIDATTRACLVRSLNASDAEVKNYFALLISGADPGLAQQALQAILANLRQCRPPANTTPVAVNG